MIEEHWSCYSYWILSSQLQCRVCWESISLVLTPSFVPSSKFLTFGLEPIDCRYWLKFNDLRVSSWLRWGLSLSAICSAHQVTVRARLDNWASSPILAASANTSGKNNSDYFSSILLGDDSAIHFRATREPYFNSHEWMLALTKIILNYTPFSLK